MKLCQIFITSFIVLAFSIIRTSAAQNNIIDRKSDAEAFIPKHKECVSNFGLLERMCLPPNRPTNCSEESWKQLHLFHNTILPCPTISKDQMEICPKLKDLNDTLTVRYYMYLYKAILNPNLFPPFDPPISLWRDV